MRDVCACISIRTMGLAIISERKLNLIEVLNHPFLTPNDAVERVLYRESENLI